jgi:hypothetical protein
LYLFSFLEKNGKTLHLLKQSSKKIKTDKPRRKIPVLGSFQEFKDSKKKPRDSSS